MGLHDDNPVTGLPEERVPSDTEFRDMLQLAGDFKGRCNPDKPMHQLFIIGFVGVALLCGALDGHADGRVWTYKMEDMYELAQNYRDMVEKKNRPTDVLDLVKAAMRAGEFKGYVGRIAGRK